MKAVVDGVVQYLSPSAIAKYNPSELGCPARWYFRYVEGRPEPSSKGQEEGTRVHEQIEAYLTRGESTLGSVARTALPFLPDPGSVQVEQNIKNLTLASIPITGRIDCLNASGTVIDEAGKSQKEPGTIEVIDWKTTSNFSYAKRAGELLATSQMSIYGLWAAQEYPFAPVIGLSHVTMLKKSGQTARKALYRSNRVELETARERLEKLVEEIKQVARETEPSKVEKNIAACAAFGGCPHRVYCPVACGTPVFARLLATERAENPNQEGEKMASIFDKLKQHKAAETQAPKGLDAPKAEEKKPSPTPAMDLLEAELLAEESALKNAAQNGTRNAAIEEIFGAKNCADCGATLSPANSSTLQNGNTKHIGCERGKLSFGASPLAPPDQPAITPEKSASPIPENLDVAPEIKDAAREMGLLEKAPEPTPEPEKKTRKPRAAKEAPKEAPKDEPKAPEMPSKAPEQASEAESKPTGVWAYGEGLVLFVDVRFETPTGKGIRLLDEVLSQALAELCQEYGVRDIRFAPKDSPLAYGGWKGALAAWLRTHCPQSGHWLINDVSESEIKQVAIEALKPACSLFVRGY